MRKGKGSGKQKKKGIYKKFFKIFLLNQKCPIFLLKTFLFVCAINPSLLNTLNPFNGHMDPRIINA